MDPFFVEVDEVLALHDDSFRLFAVRLEFATKTCFDRRSRSR